MWKLRTDKKGSWAIFKPWEYALFNYLLKHKDKEISTLEAHQAVEIRQNISRAAIINKLKDWAENGLLTTIAISGKGGIRANYIMFMSRKEAEKHIADQLVTAINEALHGVLIAGVDLES